MIIERDAVNRVFHVGRQTSGLGYFLLGFTKKDTQEYTGCITTNDGNTYGPLILEFTETGDTSPTAADGEVQLNEGEWTMVVYEQSSSTSTNPSLADRNVCTIAVRVTNDAGFSNVVYDPCDDCGSSGCTQDIKIYFNGVLKGTASSLDPCDTNTVNVTVN